MIDLFSRSSLLFNREKLGQYIMHFSKKADVKTQRKAIFFWMLGALFFAYEFILRVSPSTMQKELQSFFQIDALLLGNLSSAFYYGYAFFQIPSGLLIDRYGVRLFLSIGALMCGLGTILMTSSDVYLIAWLGRFLIGSGSAFAFVGTLKIATEWFNSDRYGLLVGLTLTLGTLGALAGGAPLAKSVDIIGWQNTLNIVGISGCIFAAIIYLCVRDKKKEVPENKKEASRVYKEILIVIKNPQSWMAGIFSGSLYIPIGVFGELWGTPYLVELCGCSRTDAAAALSAIFVGVTVGAPFYGWLSDTLKRRKSVALSGSLIALVLSIFIILGPMKTLMPFFFLMFFLGVSLGSQILMFPVAREANPSHVSGFTAGFCNTVTMFVASTAQPVVGFFLDIFSNNSDRAIDCVYSLENIRSSLMIVPFVLASACILALFIKETYAKPLK